MTDNPKTIHEHLETELARSKHNVKMNAPLRRHRIGLHQPIEIEVALRRVEKERDNMAKHGPVRVIMKDGKRVDGCK